MVTTRSSIPAVFSTAKAALMSINILTELNLSGLSITEMLTRAINAGTATYEKMSILMLVPIDANERSYIENEAGVVSRNIAVLKELLEKTRKRPGLKLCDMEKFDVFLLNHAMRVVISASQGLPDIALT